MFIRMLAALLLATSAATSAASPAPYVVMQDDLAQLKADFNAAADGVRLVFIVGPSCPVCLRGLADLNRALLDGNDDARLWTFVMHVPTLGATEKHVPDAAALVTGGAHVTHYWEDSGIVGRLYEETLGFDGIYAWDVWMVYKPGVRWEGRLPPKPDFAMQQLKSHPKVQKLIPLLDSKRFAEVVKGDLAELALPQ